MTRFTKRNVGEPHANLKVIGIVFQELLDALADYEDFMTKWAIRDLNDLDRILRGVNALGGLDHLAELHEAEKEGRIIPKCVICGNPIEGPTHNAEPFADGICCTCCNYNFVLPMRLKEIGNMKDED